MSSYAPPVEKADVVEAEMGHASDRSGNKSGTTLESFAHLDEKKILRKVGFHPH